MALAFDAEVELIHIDRAVTDPACDALGVPYVSVRRDAVVVRRSAVALKQLQLRVTNAGGIYFCGRAEWSSRIVQSTLARRVADARALSVAFAATKRIEERDPATGELRYREEGFSDEETVRSGIALILRLLPEELQRCTTENRPELGLLLLRFGTRSAAASCFRALAAVLAAVKAPPLGAVLAETVAPQDRVQLADAEDAPGEDENDREHSDDGDDGLGRAATETTASQLLDQLEMAAQEEEDAAPLAADEDDLKRRSEIVAQTMIENVTALQMPIVGPFRLIGVRSTTVAPTAAVLEAAAAEVAATHRRGGSGGSRGSPPQQPKTAQPQSSTPRDDALPFYEALNARRPEYVDEQSMRQFMAFCAGIYREVRREQRLQARAALDCAITAVRLARHCTGSSVWEVFQQWAYEAQVAEYRFAQFAMDLQRHVWHLQELDSAAQAAEERAALEADDAADSGVVDAAPEPVANPLLGVARELAVGAMSAEGQSRAALAGSAATAAQRAYVEYLLGEVDRLQRRAEERKARRSRRGRQRGSRRSESAARTRSNVFSDEAAALVYDYD